MYFFRMFRGYGTGGKGDDMDDDQQRLDHVDGVSGRFLPSRREDRE